MKKMEDGWALPRGSLSGKFIVALAHILYPFKQLTIIIKFQTLFAILIPILLQPPSKWQVMSPYCVAGRLCAEFFAQHGTRLGRGPGSGSKVQPPRLGSASSPAIGMWDEDGPTARTAELPFVYFGNLFLCKTKCGRSSPYTQKIYRKGALPRVDYSALISPSWGYLSCLTLEIGG